MKIRIALASMLAGSAAIPAAAQLAAPNSRVVQALPTRYVPPECELKPGHFKVSSGATYLKTGIEAEVPDNRSRALASGSRCTSGCFGKTPTAANWRDKSGMVTGIPFHCTCPASVRTILLRRGSMAATGATPGRSSFTACD